MKKTYQKPRLERIGTVEELTGQWSCHYSKVRYVRGQGYACANLS